MNEEKTQPEKGTMMDFMANNVFYMEIQAQYVKMKCFDGSGDSFTIHIGRRTRGSLWEDKAVMLERAINKAMKIIGEK